MRALQQASITSDSIPLLRDLLSDADGELRAWAAFAAGKLGPAVAPLAAELRTAIGDPEWTVRVLAAAALTHDPAERQAAIRVWQRELERAGDAGGTHRQSLVALAEDSSPAPSFWITALRSEDPDLRRTAIHTLGRLGPSAREALPALLAVLNDPDVHVDALDAIHLIDSGPSTASLLLKALSRPDWAVREAAFEYLGDLGSNAASAVPFLLERIRRNDGSTHAALALMRIGSDAAAALISGLDDASPDLRAWAAWTLGGLGRPAIAAVPALLRRLEDADALVRAAAVEAFGRIGAPASIALPALDRMHDDPDEPVRRLSRFAARRIGMPVAPVAPLRAAPELRNGFVCGTRDADLKARLHTLICKRPR
jgi:HEAT repeat protein